MTEAVALHVIVFHFAHALDAQRLPRQVLAGTPAALPAGHPRVTRHCIRPFAPGMSSSAFSRNGASSRTSSARVAMVNADVTPT